MGLLAAAVTYRVPSQELEDAEPNPDRWHKAPWEHKTFGVQPPPMHRIEHLWPQHRIEVIDTRRLIEQQPDTFVTPIDVPETHYPIG